MKLIRNTVGLSTLLHILLLLAAAIVGALLSYMWTVGYYISLGAQLPEAPTVTITDVAFDPQDSAFFNLTLLNPSFSPSSASAAQVMVSTGDGVLDNVAVIPTLPQELSIGKSKIFRCFWNWANYTDENVKIHVFIADGSGANFQAKTPLIDLVITDLVFNSTISVNHFNVTVRNSASSVTHVTVSGVAVDTEIVGNVTPALPYTLFPNASIAFTCPLNWTGYQGKEVTVKVETLQGYAAYYVQTIPEG
ncbi:MAG: hypothetical protein OEX99_00645 [Candidatus Bathyarchaeota archaeon]|nr:hypothetical protein [Candidatus Bathyarchaeota archaeon]